MLSRFKSTTRPTMTQILRGSRGAFKPQKPQPSVPLTSAEKQERKQQYAVDKEAKEQFKRLHAYKFSLDPEGMLNEGIQRLEERNFIFVSLDLEMFEFDPVVITEIGIAVLNMGSTTRQWPNIIGYHLLPLENKFRRNRKVMVEKRHLFAHGDTHEMTLDQCAEFWHSLLERLEKMAKEEGKQLYIVGHDVGGDLSCLSKNGFHFKRNYPVLDTVHIWQATSCEPCGLGQLLKQLNIPGRFLHNAGNDAVQTLKLLLALLDPVVRKQYKLDEGPSLAEANYAMKKANRLAKAERLKAAAKQSESKQSAEAKEAAKAETRAAQDATRRAKQARERARYDKMANDMPGVYEKGDVKSLLELVERC